MAVYAIGFDIGGTKCAVILGEFVGADDIRIVAKTRFATKEAASPQDCLLTMCSLADELLNENSIDKSSVCGIGISCGGPLDPARGIIQSPPNLPGWDDIPAVKIVTEKTGLPAKLENDANACALAEWKFGAGRGFSDMVFLTFGTGLGAGIIAGGRLLAGRSGMAGECGHIRLAADGPVGYGKAGSFEGFCSGGGIAQLGKMYAEEAFRKGKPVAWCPTPDKLDGVNAKVIGDAAENGDEDAVAVYALSGKRLGEGLSVLIDILNPERIVIGSIFARSEKLLRPAMQEVIDREALPQAAGVCKVVPAQLGEAIGDIASLAIAKDTFGN